MKKQKPLTDAEGEVRELTLEDFKQFRPGYEFMTPEQLAMVREHKRNRGQRGPGKVPAKEHITLRLDPDIVAYYREFGPGWQKRINEDLRRTAKL